MLNSLELILARIELDALMDTSGWDSLPSGAAASAAHLAASAVSETASDARSAPLDFLEFYQRIGDECGRLLCEAGRVLPPDWAMLEVINVTCGDDAIRDAIGAAGILIKPEFLRKAYYNLMMHGINSWGFQELLYFVEEMGKLS